MSDVSQGPGWWLASDGRWYPPDQVPGYTPVGSTEVPVARVGLDPSGAPVPGGPPDPVGMGYPEVPGHGVPGAGGYPSVGNPGYGPTPVQGYPPPGYGMPSAPPLAAPGYPPPGDPGYGYPPPGNPAYDYPSVGPGYGYVPVRKTNGLAIASLVCSLIWLGGLGSILAILFGFIARAQIKKSEGPVEGSGLALAGIIVGFVGLVAMAALVIAVVAVVHHCDQTGNCTTNTYNFGN